MRNKSKRKNDGNRLNIFKQFVSVLLTALIIFSVVAAGIGVMSQTVRGEGGDEGSPALPDSNRPPKTTESLRIAVLSDLHYYPASFTGGENEAFKKAHANATRLVAESADVTRAALEMIRADAPEVLLITGGLTHKGEKQSAIELANLLRAVEADGIKVFVINGDNEINSREAVSYASNRKRAVANMSPSEFRQIFRDFGYDGRDFAAYYQGLNTVDGQFKQGGMSYIVSPKPGYKILMLDTAVYTPDFAGRSEAMLSPELLEWVDNQLEIAYRNNEIVIAGVHHPLLIHYGNNYHTMLNIRIFETADDARVIAERFANANLKTVFSGHMYGNDIAEHVSRKGNKIVEAQTASPLVSGSPIRYAVFSGDDVTFESRSIQQINRNGQTIDYQKHLRDKLYAHSLLNRTMADSILKPVNDTLMDIGLYGVFESLLGVNIKQTVEDTIIRKYSKTQEYSLKVGKIKVNVQGVGTNNPYIHMWPTGVVGFMPDYDVPIRNQPDGSPSIHNGLDDLFITQFNAKWLTVDASGKTRLERAFEQVFTDVGNVVVHANGTTLSQFYNLSRLSYIHGAEEKPAWVQEVITDLKVTLTRRIVVEALIPSMKRNIINPILDEMYLDINKTAPSQGVYRSLIRYILSGSFSENEVSLRDLLMNLADIDVDAEIDELVERHVNNDSDIGMLGNELSSFFDSQWTDSLGQDDAINGIAVIYTIADADPNAPVEVMFKNLHLGVGARETELLVTWQSTSADNGVVRLAKKYDSPGKGKMPNDPSKIREFKARVGATNDVDFFVNKARITGLKPNTDYIYQVINEGIAGEVYEFNTGSHGTSWSFVFTGDPQLGSSGSLHNDKIGWYSSLDLIYQRHPGASFLLSAGDQVEKSDNLEQYDALLNHDSLKRVPLTTVVGNHDDGSVAYSQHFSNPNVQADSGIRNAGEEGGNFWFIYNNVLFISLNANNRVYGEHIDFIEQITGMYNARTDWQIVTFHQSIFSAASHSDSAGIVHQRNQLAPVLSRCGIDLVLMGHDHSYVRTYLMNGTTPQVDSPVKSVHVNPGENEVLYVTADSSASKHYSLKGAKQPYAAVRNQEGLNNISYVEVKNNALTVRTYRTEIADLVPYRHGNDMTIVDEVTLILPAVPATAGDPTLRVPGDARLHISEAAHFNPLVGVKAFDANGFDISGNVTVEGNVDPEHDGSYKLVYSVNDNGTEITKVRFVTVYGNVYIVNFESMGGSPVASLNDVEGNSCIEAPAAPTKAHHRFTGWYKDREATKPFDFTHDVINGDLTLYAGWAADQYSVNFVTNSVDTVAPRTVDALSTLELPVLATTGSDVFGGWYTDAEFTEPWLANTPVKKNITLYARWIAPQESLAVIHPTNGDPMRLIRRTTGETVGVLDEPVRSGYVFAGYNTARDGSGATWNLERDVINTDELHLYAQWDYTYVTVAVVDRFGGREEFRVVKGRTLEDCAAPERKFYDFTGLSFDEAGTNPYEEGFAFQKDTTLYVNWNNNVELTLGELEDVELVLPSDFGDGSTDEPKVDLEIPLEVATNYPDDLRVRLIDDFDGRFALQEGAVVATETLDWGIYELTVSATVDRTLKEASFTVTVNADTTNLKQLLAEAHAKEIAPALLAPIDAEARLNVIDQAKSVIAKPAILGAQTASAESRVTALITTLDQIIGARSALAVVVTEGESISPEPYTEDSLADLAETLSVGRKILTEGQATDWEIDVASADVRAAIDALALIPPSEPEPDVSDPDSKDPNPGTDVSKLEPGATDPKPGTTDPESDEPTPKPGVKDPETDVTNPEPDTTDPDAAEPKPESGVTEPESEAKESEPDETAPPVIKLDVTEPGESEPKPEPNEPEPKPNGTELDANAVEPVDGSDPEESLSFPDATQSQEVRVDSERVSSPKNKDGADPAVLSADSKDTGGEASDEKPGVIVWLVTGTVVLLGGTAAGVVFLRQPKIGKRGKIR
ncbi:MAG: DUF5011 domain-containing protein [Clostridiaceae bacterium]|nr:DUF5011 domain-containing protein [Clostridiaceae bacterium]